VTGGGVIGGGGDVSTTVGPLAIQPPSSQIQP
jgi:hypothetical protein